jgi:hypothetical protein
MSTSKEPTILFMMVEHGELLLSYISHDPEAENIFILDTPAHVVHERAQHGILGFMLTPWLPNELTQDLRIRIQAAMLRGTLTPTPELLHYYKVWAETEREKMKLFSKEFYAQITSIEKFHVEKFESTKERKKRDTFVNPNAVPEELAVLFDAESEWGDSTVTH